MKSDSKREKMTQMDRAAPSLKSNSPQFCRRLIAGEHLRHEDEDTTNERNDDLPAAQSPGSVREEGLNSARVESVKEREGGEPLGLCEWSPETKVLHEEVLDEDLGI